MDFAVLADHRGKLQESKKRDKYLDLARELKILWKMKMSVISIIIGPLGTVTKELVQGVMEDLEIKEKVETIQATALLGLARIFKRVWRLDETYCHSNSRENAGVKDSQKSKMIIITCPWEWDSQNYLGFWGTNRSPNLNQTTRPSDSQQQKRKKNQK